MKLRTLPRFLTLACVLALSTGCLYIDVKTPFDTDLDRTTLGNKEGRAQMQSVLGLVAWGDASTQAAAEQGQLKTIHHADMEVFSILGFLYTRQTLVVYGE